MLTAIVIGPQGVSSRRTWRRRTRPRGWVRADRRAGRVEDRDLLPVGPRRGGSRASASSRTCACRRRERGRRCGARYAASSFAGCGAVLGAELVGRVPDRLARARRLRARAQRRRRGGRGRRPLSRREGGGRGRRRHEALPCPARKLELVVSTRGAAARVRAEPEHGGGRPLMPGSTRPRSLRSGSSSTWRSRGAARRSSAAARGGAA